MAEVSPMIDIEALAPVSSIALDARRTTADPIGTVAIPVRDTVNTRTMFSMLATDWPEPTDKLFANGNLLALQRNTLVQRMRGDWILFIDDDMVWEPDAMKRLLASRDALEAQGHEVDVLGALCCRRQPPYQPTLYVRHKSGAYNFLEDWETDIIEVDATGMAFALISKRAFERIAGTPMPPYEERTRFDKSPDFFRWIGSLGEDLRFCQDLKTAGGHIYVDTTIRIGHLSEKEVGLREFWEEIVDRDPEVTNVRRKANRKMGLNTLTPTEARRRLRDR
jgi:glycosyltransferase involved in cell wall biosynthesis